MISILRKIFVPFMAITCVVTLGSCRLGNKTVEKKENTEFPAGYYEIANSRINSQPTATFQYCAQLAGVDSLDCRDPAPNDPLPGMLLSKMLYNPMGVQTNPKVRLALLYNPTLKQDELSRYLVPANYDANLRLAYNASSPYTLYHPDIPSDQACQARAYRQVTGNAKKYDTPFSAGGVSILGSVVFQQEMGNTFDLTIPVCKKTLKYYQNCYLDVARCFDSDDHDLFVEIFQPYIDAGVFTPGEIDRLEKFGFQLGVE